MVIALAAILFIEFSKKASRSRPIQKITSASCNSFACEGFSEYVWGEPAPFTSNVGSPIPSEIAETRECIGLIEATTFISAYEKVVLVIKNVDASIVCL